jgi:hypothetical protein
VSVVAAIKATIQPNLFMSTPSNALPFRCKGRYVMVDSTTAGATRRRGPVRLPVAFSSR